MNHSRFALSLGVTTLILGLILLYWHSLPGWSTSASFSFLYSIFMVGFSIIAYLMGIVAGKSSNPNTLTRLMLLLIVIKLVGSLAIAIGYFESNSGSDKLFIWPFIVIYLIYTIVEIYWFNQINDQATR